MTSCVAIATLKSQVVKVVVLRPTSNLYWLFLSTFLSSTAVAIICIVQFLGNSSMHFSVQLWTNCIVFASELQYDVLFGGQMFVPKLVNVCYYIVSSLLFIFWCPKHLWKRIFFQSYTYKFAEGWFSFWHCNELHSGVYTCGCIFWYC